MDTKRTVDTETTLEGSKVFEIGRVTEETQGAPIAAQESPQVHPGELN